MCLTLLWRAVCSPRLNTGQVTLWICFQSELLWLRQSVSQSESVPRTRLRSSWYSKQRDHHMTWKAKAFAHWEENGFFFILFHFYFGGIFIVSRINFRHFLLTHRNMKTWGGGKQEQEGGRKNRERNERREVLFEMDIIYLKIFLLKFGITVFLSLSGKEVPWLVGFVDPSLSPHAVTCRCHHWPGGRHLYSREMKPFRFCLREQPMHLAGNSIHCFRLAFHFSISSSGDLA